jgi:hypothetical protein
MLGVVVRIGRNQVDKRARVDCPSLHFYWRFSHEDVNLRQDGAIRGKRRIIIWEERGE